MSVLDEFQARFAAAKGRTLIVGSKIHDDTGKDDRRLIYPDALGVDMEAGEGVDRVLNLESRLPRNVGKFSHIECTSVLEHSRRPWLLAANLERLLIEGGTILVLVPWIWRVHNYPGDFYRYTSQGIAALFSSIHWEESSYIVEGRLTQKVPKATLEGVRYLARSELIMFGRKCASTS